VKTDVMRSAYDQVFVIAGAVNGQTLKAGVLFVERNMGETATLAFGGNEVTVRLPSEFIGQSQPRVGMELTLEIL
jgi:hypothetical protein